MLASSPPCGACPGLPVVIRVTGGDRHVGDAQGLLDLHLHPHLVQLKVQLGQEVEVDLVVVGALPSLQQLIIGQLEDNPALRLHFHRHCEAPLLVCDLIQLLRFIELLYRLLVVQNFSHKLLSIDGHLEVGDEGILGQHHVEGHFLLGGEGVRHSGLDDSLGIAVYYLTDNLDLCDDFVKHCHCCSSCRCWSSSSRCWTIFLNFLFGESYSFAGVVLGTIRSKNCNSTTNMIKYNKMKNQRTAHPVLIYRSFSPLK